MLEQKVVDDADNSGVIDIPKEDDDAGEVDLA